MVQTEDAPLMTTPKSQALILTEAGRDVGDIERLWQIQMQMDDRTAVQLYNASMVKAQGAMPAIVKDAQGYESKYAKLEKIIKAIMPIYSAEGFAVSYSEGDASEKNHIRIIAAVMHISGHTERHHIDVAIDNSGSKNTTQAKGSSVAYAKRYLICMIFNIVLADEDDDGQAASAQLITAEQAKELAAGFKEAGSDMVKVAKLTGAKKVEDIPAIFYGTLLKIIKDRIERNEIQELA